MLASHIVFGCYGFWLPNDPHGSWSRYVGSRELHRFGDATTVDTDRALSSPTHDHGTRLAAKNALQREPLRLTGEQARASVRGFAQAAEESGYVVRACAIMPDHVHLVVEEHRWHPKRIMSHMKGRATKRMREEELLPPDSQSPWARNGWCVYLDEEDDVLHAIEYVEANPIRAGLKPQNWSFVERLHIDEC